MRVLGIDPGLHCTGYAVLDANGSMPSVREAGIISTPVSASLTQRLVELDEQFEAILSESKPAMVAVEALYSHYRHPRTAILMGHARGVVLLAAGRHGLSVRDLPATQIKRSVAGSGRASKERMQRAVQTCLGLAAPPSPPDVADACAAALTALKMAVVEARI